mgnify:CR=1 FL=1
MTMGRHIRKMTMAEATAVAMRARPNALICADCPKYANCWCSVFAHCSVPRAPACGYGKRLINAAKVAMKRKGSQNGNA